MELGNDFGYLPDPPKKEGESPDLDFAELRTKLAAVSTGDVDFRDHTTSTNQYSLPSCVGNATADSVEILNSLEGRPHVELSRQFVWTLCRNMEDKDRDGRGDVDKKTGTYIRLAFDVLNTFGVCPEKYWPYNSPWNRLPSLKAMRKATGHKIKAYHRISGRGDDRLDQVLTALRSGHPVVFGTRIPKDFGKLDDEGPVGIPSDPGGGHAMICVGYLTGLGFIIKNSWGTNWGDNGFFIMKPEYMAWDKTWDLWVPTRGVTFSEAA